MNIYLQPLWRGTLAQLVEQRTENPCVPGSIPGGTTLKPLFIGVFCFLGVTFGGNIFLYFLIYFQTPIQLIQIMKKGCNTLV